MATSPDVTLRRHDGTAIVTSQPASQPGDVFPAGSVVMWAGAAAPTGWLICDGSAVSRATYDDLFANIGTTWGAGDGSTTFNIPDFRDRVPVGKSGSKALASSGGAETHALSIAEMPSHAHTVWEEYFGVSSFNGPPPNTYLFQVVTGSSGTPWNHPTESQGSGTAHNNMQPYRAINYIIRAY